ncbi:hypothetical protein [uncultured Aquimarina sp.]|uniref:hypothetical protein n=1 Tax=uncultured Aquimarina sp. TaxID=575652 RepID=UPI002609F413|nr:hypothetical protein [uncultured Aquimarina sp.]
MKTIITLSLLLLSIISLAQTNQVVGDYIITLGKQEKHHIEYKLSLKEDGTFFFHSYSNNSQGIPNEVNIYGKGTWKIEKNVVHFFADKKKDINEKYSLDFNNSKARFISKSPRDKTDRVIKTCLQFFNSKIFWIKRLRIFKKNSIQL